MNIEQIKQGHPLSQSENIVENNIEKLKELFPEIITEGKIDFKVLQKVLGEEVEEGEEYYRFTWAGKANARREAQKPSTGTLRPAPEESVDWDTTQNLYIEGDNLEVLKLLQKSYANKVKMIYIDPPYNTGKDFVYKDNYKDNLRNYQEVTGQLDEAGNRLSTNSDSDGRYHSNWLNMIYPRLLLSRNLLKDDGVILISLDDHEDYNMRKVCNEVFGEDNYITTLIWNKQHSQQQGVFKKYHEYVIVYSKNSKNIKNISGGKGIITAGAMKRISRANPESTFSFPKGVRIEAEDGKTFEGTFGGSEQVTVVDGVFKAENGVTKYPITLSAGWTQKDQMDRFFKGEEVFDTKGQKVLEFYFSSTGKIKCRKERTKITPSTLLKKYGMVSEQTAYLKKLMGESIFDNPKPVGMLDEFVSWFCDSENDIVMDYFSGSGTIGDAVFRNDNNINFICVQLPELIDDSSDSGKLALKLDYKKITDIAKERLRLVSNEVKNDKNKDLGFKVFKLDTSNIKAWDGNPEELEQNLFDAQDNIKEDRSEHDVLYEILLKYGLDLTLPIEEKVIEGKTVFNVGFGSLFICLGDDLTSKVAQGIGEWKEELQPEVCRVIFKDAGFTDVEKTNSVQTLKRFGITEVKSI